MFSRGLPSYFVSVEKFIPIFVVILVSTALGYALRRLGLLGEKPANVLMTAITVVGYPLIGLVTIWKIRLAPEHIWLPVIACLQMVLLMFLAAPLGAWLTKDRGERGVFMLASVFGNHGLTMGGFVIFLLFGDQALGLASMFFLFFSVMVVLLGYPISRHYSSHGPPQPLWKLLLRSLFDWRSLALPISLTGAGLSLARVPVPAFIDDLYVVPILLYGINVAAYFSIGLRLRMSHVPQLKKLIVGTAVTRFPLGLATGLLLIGLTYATPWPLQGLAVPVVIIQSYVSTAVTFVALANMFDLRPGEASVVFVANTLIYLVAVLPPTMLVFS